jgi:Histidine kinase
MKLISILALFFLCTQTSYSQQDEVLRKDDSLQQLLHKNINDSFKVKILEELHNLWKNKNYGRSIEYIREAIALSDKTPATGYNSLGLRYELGFALMEVGDAVRSIETFQQIVKELDGKYPEEYSTALAFIGMNYETQGNIKTALEYQRKASIIYDKLILEDSTIDRRGVLGGPQQLAELYLKNNQLDSALFYGQQGLNRLKNEPLNDFNRFFSWQIKTTLGDIYSQLKEYDPANKLYIEAQREATLYSSQPDLISIYLSRSKLYYKQKDLKTALEYAKRTYALADTLKLLPIIKEASLFLKTIYRDLNNMDSALYYYDIAMTAKDSLFNADIARKIDAMEFAEQKRAQESKTFQQEKAFQKKQFYLIAGVLLSILLAAFFYYKNRLKQKANQLLEYENKEIFLQRNQLQQDIESFEMQALRAQLNPHFIFNCLNSIDAFIYSNDKYKATMYLNKFAKLLRNILDSSKNNTVSLGKDIQSLRLYTDLEELRNDNKFETQYHIDETLATDEYAVPPLIVQPLVENAILHGLKNKKEDKGVLIISIKQLGEKLQYQVMDNGIGRSASAKIPQHKEYSYGMELTRSRIKMFNKEESPSLTIEDLYDQDIATGTRVSVTLNLQAV